MKKMISISIIVSLVLALVPVSVFAHTAEDPFVTDLVSGGGSVDTATDIGDVRVWNDGDSLFVEYVVTDEAWCLTQTHLEVSTSLGEIPQKNGNPIPGQFTYGGVHDCIPGVIYTISMSWDSGSEILIAAHGVAQTGGTNGLGIALPDQVTIDVTFPGHGFGEPSYFDVTISGGTLLDGTYDAYCVDLDSGYFSGTANVYSSYEPLPSFVPIEYPENLDRVNWIINQDYLSKISSYGGNYTYGDLQWAIWKLLDGGEPSNTSSLGDWSLYRAQEILAAAYANGEGFVPACGEVMAIILAHPSFFWKQPVIIWLEVPCAESETTWGGDYFGTPLEFPGKNWAIYFAYTVQ